MPVVRTVQERLKTILPILNSNYILLHLASPSLRDVHSLVLNLPLINYASSIRISVVELVEVVEVVVVGQLSAPRCVVLIKCVC